MPPCCLEEICQGTASSGGAGEPWRPLSCGWRWVCCLCPPQGQAVLGSQPNLEMGLETLSSAVLGQRQTWESTEPLPCPGSGRDIPRRFAYILIKMYGKKERKKNKSQESDSSGAATGLFCAGGKARPWPGPGGPREPGRRQDPLQPLWDGCCPALSPSSLPPGRCQARPCVGRTGVEGQDGCGSSWHTLQPLKLCAHMGLCC